MRCWSEYPRRKSRFGRDDSTSKPRAREFRRNAKASQTAEEKPKMTEEDVKRLKDQLTENLAAPKAVQTDSGSVENQSVSQMIAALEYLKKQNAETGDPMKRVGIYKLRNRD
jgi:hypothetical protein